MALAIVLAAVNVLGGFRPITSRLSSRRGRDVDAHRRATPAVEDRRRSDGRRPRALRTLDDARRVQYVARWQQLHRRATALPATTLLDADDLLDELLQRLGYPTEGFVQYAAGLSPAHADVVDDYRVARSVVLDTRLGLADTAQIRHALLRYAAVFACLTGTDLPGRANRAAA